VRREVDMLHAPNHSEGATLTERATPSRMQSKRSRASYQTGLFPFGSASLRSGSWEHLYML